MSSVTKVRFLHLNWQTGGVERTNIQWIKALVRRGVNVEVVTTGSGTVDFEHALFTVRTFRSVREVSGYLLRSADDACRLIVCQSYLLKPFFFTLIKLRFKCVRLVLAERNSVRQYQSKPIKLAAFCFTLPFIHLFFYRIIVNSKEMQGELPFRLCSNVDVVINPRFDDDIEFCTSGLREELDRKFVYIGRWDQQKGIDVVSKFANLCSERQIAFEAFCGQDELCYQRPFLNNVLEFLSNHNVCMVFFSEFEGYPNILVEARTCGIPIIYRHCKTGVGEVLHGYKNCFRVEGVGEDNLYDALKWGQSAEVCEIDYEFAARHFVSRSNIFSAVCG